MSNFSSSRRELTAADGHTFAGYWAVPASRPRAGLLVIQEIFGVNGHIRAVTDDYARRGFLSVAPALFDRVKPGVDLGYDQFAEARDMMQQVRMDDVAKDLAATVQAVRDALGGQSAPTKVGAVGYCWGGAIADFAACRTDIQAAVSYYGRANVNWLNEKPRCPVMYHFGAKDFLIPPEVVEQISAGRPGQPVHVYADAGHGFNCDERPEYHAPSAKLALERTLTFFRQHLE